MPSSRSSRRSSVGSVGSVIAVTTPLLPAHDEESTPGLILVPDDDGTHRDDFELSSDDEIVDDISARLDRLKASSIPPLQPSRVFLYLLIPYLRLGSFLLSTESLPLKFSIPALIFFALCAFASRRISYMITKYVHKADFEDVVLDTFARGPSRERSRALLRTAVRTITTAFRILLSAVYLNAASTVLVPLFPNELAISSHVLLIIVLSLLALPLTLATSLASRAIHYATTASILAYLLWLPSVAFAHAHGTLIPNPQWTQLGALWTGVVPILFTFTSSWTLPLYAALKASSPRHAPASKPSKRYSFQTLSAASVIFASALLLPLCFFAAHPSAPVRASSPSHHEPDPTALSKPQNPAHPPHALIAAANALALLLTVPPLLLTAPPLPLSPRTPFRRPLSKVLLLVATLALALLPRVVQAVLSDIVLVCSVGSTFVVPALLHIITYNFRSPLSIVLPSTPSALLRPSTPSPANQNQQTHTSTDELLRRKERMLQRRRLTRRLAWDGVAWMLVLVFGVGGVVGAAGRIARVW